MAGQIYPLDEEKSPNAKTNSGADITIPNENADIKWMFKMGTEKVWCSQAPEEAAGANTHSSLYNSRIVNNYIEYLQEFHPDIGSVMALN